MKNIIDYYTNTIINDSLDLHFYVEFVLRDSFKYSFFNINEKHGAYIGQKELIIDLAKEIWLVIDNQEPYDKIELDKKDLSMYNNIFFEKLIVYLGKNGSYNNSAKSKFNKNTNLLDEVVINIDYNHVESYADVCSILMHEILHAFNNYKGYVTNAKYSLSDLTSAKSSYAKTILSTDKVTVETICQRILNNIRQWEQNAYISELSIELDKYNFDISRFNTVQDAYKEAKKIFVNSDVWKQYTVLYRYLIYKINTNDEFKERFKNTYNSINNTDLSYSKIYKKLTGIFNKILEKIEREIPKIFYNYYQEQLKNSLNEGTIAGRQTKAYIEFLSWCTEYTLLESVKADNGEPWIVYVNDNIDKTFTEHAKNWKKKPQVGKGWYCGGSIFTIVKIENNKIYTKTE
jgi:hypothetical protein